MSPARPLHGWRLPLLLAGRDVLRSRGRSALVLVMIALPVLAVTAALVVQSTQSVSGVESLDRRLGAADARVSVQRGAGRIFQDFDPDLDYGRGSGQSGRALVAPSLGDVRRVLAAEVPALEQRTGGLRVTTDKGVGNADGLELDLADPLAGGLVDLTSGRLPRDPGEVVVNPALAAKGYAVGDRLELLVDSAQGLTPGGAPRIVGIAESASSRTSPLAAGPVGSLGLTPHGAHTWLVGGGPVSWSQVLALNATGATVLSRAVVLDPPPDSALAPQLAFYGGGDDTLLAVLVLVVVMALIEVVLLAGPAFAVSARRQSRTLALLAAAGGTPAQARRVVLAGGVVLGGLAAVLGVLLGIATGWALLPVVQHWSSAWFGPFEIPWLRVVGVGCFGLLSALLAAVVPAWIASRQDVVAVLGGRRGDRAASLRSPVLGLALLAVGVVGAVHGAGQRGGGELWIAGSAIVSVLGMILLVPVVLVVLAAASRWLPLSLRYAARDAARHRTRTVPAVAAVAATVAGVVALGIALTSDAAESRATYTATLPVGQGSLTGYGLDPTLWPELRRLVVGAAPGVTVAPVVGAAEQYGVEGRRQVTYSLDFREPGVSEPVLTGYASNFGASVLVADELPTVVSGLNEADRSAAEAALASGGAVVLSDRTVSADEVLIRGSRDQGRRSQRLPRTHAGAVYVRWAEGYSPFQAVVSPEVASSLGLQPSTVSLALSGPELTTTQETNLRESVAAITSDAGLYVERGYQNDDQTRIIQLILGALGAVLMLGGTLTATFLALSDARPDLATLAAVGASPRRRRGVAAAYALVVGLVGALLGAGVGLIPGIAVTYPLTGVGNGAYRPDGLSLPDHFVVIPWLLIGAVVVGLPLFTALVVGLAARSRLPLVARLD